MKLEELLTTRSELCPYLRWKGQFIEAERHVESGDDSVWCMFTQTCIGPDSRPADRETCTDGTRPCYGKGKV